jgi:hypothetical protein
MEIPKKFEVNTDDFKIYFDNDKKTYVCENLETGEKTNIGVIGIFLQMGIIKPVEEKTDDKIKIITEKLSSLEMKLDQMTKNVNNASVKPEKEETEESEETIEEEEKVQEKPKSEIRDRIMKKVLKQAEEETEEPEEAVEGEPEDSDVVSESDEEIENWNEI